MRRIAAFVCLSLGLSSCAAAGDVAAGIGSGGQCRVLAEIAGQLNSDNYDPKVRGGPNCTREFAAANLPMLGVRKPNDPKDAPGLDHILQFEKPERLDANTMKVKVSYTCFRLCGHGEEVTAELKDGHWEITDKKMTWIS